ncbi:hypothetical protein E4U21_004313 [Claviceps maximensis]|nr:hypothetical protein E4U21_004313 [Claviceps maximensis]
MRFSSIRGAMTAVADAATTLAAPASYCSIDNEVCFQWGVPDEAAPGSGSGSIYFQLRAPTSYSWISIGIGTQMAGSDMFVVYDNGNGNVTLSTRAGLRHAMPEYRAQKGAALLAGSGIVDGHMVANVRCGGDCARMSRRGPTNWISAWKSGSSLASTSEAARIGYHDGHDGFSVDLSRAVISSDENPFLNDSGMIDNGDANGPGNATAPGTPAGGGVVKKPDQSDSSRIIHAHGLIMSLVFVLGFPVGSVLMPWLGKWFVHASWQMMFFVLMWTGFALGYVFSSRFDMFFVHTHTRLGTVLCILMSFQPVLGWLHHKHFVTHRQRGPISHTHIWYGRALIILGMVNGGLGLQAAPNAGGLFVAYCVVASVISALYVASTVLVSLKRRAGRAGRGTESAARSSDEERK